MFSGCNMSPDPISLVTGLCWKKKKKKSWPVYYTDGLQWVESCTVALYFKHIKVVCGKVCWRLVPTFLRSAVVCLAWITKLKVCGSFLKTEWKGLYSSCILLIVLYTSKLRMLMFVGVCDNFFSNPQWLTFVWAGLQYPTACVLFFQAEGKDWSRSRLCFIWNASKLLRLKFVGV